jgi:predicted SnoaL-like aldol condensation-catalyzing enzyme
VTDAACRFSNATKGGVVAFYDISQCRPREAIERFVGDEYFQHNPHVAGGT